jgi:hypothetical protein
VVADYVRERDQKRAFDRQESAAQTVFDRSESSAQTDFDRSESSALFLPTLLDSPNPFDDAQPEPARSEGDSDSDKEGVPACDADELAEYLMAQNPPLSQATTQAALTEAVRAWRAAGYKDGQIRLGVCMTLRQRPRPAETIRNAEHYLGQQIETVRRVQAGELTERTKRKRARRAAAMAALLAECAEDDAKAEDIRREAERQAAEQEAQRRARLAEREAAESAEAARSWPVGQRLLDDQTGKPGSVVGHNGSHLLVQFDGEPEPRERHPANCVRRAAIPNHGVQP